MDKYEFKKVEPKWRALWEKMKIYKAPESVKNKMYVLPQLPYPSGSGLHTGHSSVYIPCDIYARYQRMVGKDVLQVIGWDAFGLPAENYAIKTNVHPRINTNNAIDNFRSQIKAMGLSLDFDREVGSHNPDYYKWTQWFFLLMYKNGLAYRAKQVVNWCDSCKTVLANEQVIEDKCERCGTHIMHKEMEQWYLKITDYADRLSKDLDKIDWPKSTIDRQRNWIGKSEGASINFNIYDKKKQLVTSLEVFTTAHDTIYGVTFMAIAPENKILTHNKGKIENWSEVESYINLSNSKTELERQQDKNKSGVLIKGLYAVNPINKSEIPIFVADYVLSSYGSGAVMGVPGHDERDFEFAKKYKQAIVYVTDTNKFVSYSGEIKSNTTKYILINSGKFNGMNFEKGRKAILKELVILKVGDKQIQFKLHDWSVSRQRFWGAPIPMLLKELPDREFNVLVFHGTGASSKSNWFSWFKEKMKSSRNVEVAVPDLPDSLNPKYQVRMKFINENYKEYITNSSVIIGHSSGALSALQIASKHKVRKLILVSPVMYIDDDYRAKLAEYFEPDTVADLVAYAEEGIDHKKVAANVDEIVIVFGKNDPYLPIDDFAKFAREKYPDAVIKVIQDKAHLNSEDKTTEFEELLDLMPTSNIVMKPVPEKDLPVLLPDDVDFKPTGQSPLTYSKEFQAGVEAKYGKGWKREVDTLDTFMCSSWYYFRYIDPHNDKEFASKEAISKWMPVDFYIGGPEHVNGHLLYSRFFTKVLFDAGYINFDEPFLFHRHQGMVLGEDNRKMSKRWGNVINPSEVMDEYGADTLRVYQMFMGPLEQTKAWSTNGIRGVNKFINKIWELFHSEVNGKGLKDLSMIDKTVKKVSVDIDSLSFNTAVAQMMEFTNWYKKNLVNLSSENRKEIWNIFLRVLAPFAPYITEELWKELGHKSSIHLSEFPKFDEERTKLHRVTIAVQVNGKLRGTFDAELGISEDEAIEKAKTIPGVAKYLEEGKFKKAIYVNNKLVSFVV